MFPYFLEASKTVVLISIYSTSSIVQRYKMYGEISTTRLNYCESEKMYTFIAVEVLSIFIDLFVLGLKVSNFSFFLLFLLIF